MQSVKKSTGAISREIERRSRYKTTAAASLCSMRTLSDGHRDSPNVGLHVIGATGWRPVCCPHILLGKLTNVWGRMIKPDHWRPRNKEEVTADTMDVETRGRRQFPA